MFTYFNEVRDTNLAVQRSIGPMLRLFRFLRPFSVVLAVTLALLFLQSLADLYLPTLMADIVDHGVVQSDIDYIWSVGGVMLVVAGIGAICSIVAAFFSSRIAVGFGRDLRTFCSRVFRVFAPRV